MSEEDKYDRRPTGDGYVHPPLSARVINSGDKIENVPLKELQTHPANPRKGRVNEISRSILVNGFYGALIVQKSTGYILAGNHRFKAARRDGFKSLPVIYVDVDDERAKRIVLADNKTSDMGGYDDAILSQLLEGIQDSMHGLDGTGYKDQEALEIIKAQKAVLASIGDVGADGEGVDLGSSAEVEIDPHTRLAAMNDGDRAEMGDRVVKVVPLDDGGAQVVDEETGEVVASFEATERTAAREVIAQFSDIEAEDTQDKDDGKVTGAPHVLWPSSNKFGIPDLNPAFQGDLIDLPFLTWGQRSRYATVPTIIFYVDDDKFEHLWKKPHTILDTKPVTAFELNYSTDARWLSMAEALFNTYKKRWISRYLQDNNIRIFVDVNVAWQFWEINLMGVPRSWGAFSTRIHKSRDGGMTQIEMLNEKYKRLRKWSKADQIVFVVYGGGVDIKELCGQNGWWWLPDAINVVHGNASFDDVIQGLSLGDKT